MKSMQKIVVYTAVTNGYDRIASNRFRNCDFICFSDRNRPIPGWDVRPLPFEHADPVRTARAIKVLPHRFLSEYDISIWIDGNIRLLRNPVSLINRLDSHFPLHVFAHPERRTLSEELEACIRKGKDNPGILREQVRQYIIQGYSEGGNLIESGVLVRWHNDPSLAEAMELWFQEIKRYSRRDQISFPYVVWKTGLRFRVMGKANARENSRYFLISRHAKDIGSTRFETAVRSFLRLLRACIRTMVSKY